MVFVVSGCMAALEAKHFRQALRKAEPTTAENARPNNGHALRHVTVLCQIETSWSPHSGAMLLDFVHCLKQGYLVTQGCWVMIANVDNHSQADQTQFS